jgi:hypothetical protein
MLNTLCLTSKSHVLPQAPKVLWIGVASKGVPATLDTQTTSMHTECNAMLSISFYIEYRIEAPMVQLLVSCSAVFAAGSAMAPDRTGTY